jgi:hypothetical protein
MSQRPLTARLGVGVATVFAVLVNVAAPVNGAKRAEIPLDGRLVYSVSWLGVHCGEMTIESAAVDGKPALVRMLMTMRSSELFDRIYRVRGEIESIYNVRRQRTLRYHETSSEQDETKDDLWIVAPASGRVRRTLNGKEETFRLPAGAVHDPLSLLYRIRSLAAAPGTEFTLTAMTTEGALDVLVRVERWERFDTPAGEATALKVVQQAVGDEAFGRGGGMTLWLAADERRTPYRIEFDLPFGTLVAERAEAAADEAE